MGTAKVCCLLTNSISEQPPIKKKGRYQGEYKEFACGMGFGNFTENYYIKLSVMIWHYIMLRNDMIRELIDFYRLCISIHCV